MRGLPRREERMVASHFADLAWTRRAISAGVPRHAAGLFNRFREENNSWQRQPSCVPHPLSRPIWATLLIYFAEDELIVIALAT